MWKERQQETTSLNIKQEYEGVVRKKQRGEKSARRNKSKWQPKGYMKKQGRQFTRGEKCGGTW
jgi:hypothetical protein